MCSVSFLPNSRGFYVGMNRDESLQRPVAQPPELFLRAGRSALYPTEPGGGTWIGVNASGLCVALINWYAIPRRPGIGLVRRGIIVPALLTAQTFDNVRTAMLGMPLHDIAPFRLIVFAPREKTVREFRWDQDTLGEQPHVWEPRHWFSSGFDEPAAQHERGQVCRAAWQQPRAGSLPWLRRLHASHRPARGPFSMCMHRRDAATVSYTEVVVTRHEATLRYHDGPLCCAPLPVTTHKISLQAACKESAPTPTNEETRHCHENHESSLQPSRRSLLPRGISPRGDLLEIAH